MGSTLHYKQQHMPPREGLCSCITDREAERGGRTSSQYVLDGSLLVREMIWLGEGNSGNVDAT